MFSALFLFINKVTTPKNFTSEDYRALGAYIVDPARSLRDFELVDTNNQPFFLQNFKGKWNVLFFGFSHCPDICPITMSLLAKAESVLVERGIGEIKFFMVTVDPERDSTLALRQYLDNFSEDFEGLTGNLDQIYKLATQVNSPFIPVTKIENPNYTVDHSGSIVLINPEGNYAGFFRAPYNKENIINALSELSKKIE